MSHYPKTIDLKTNSEDALLRLSKIEKFEDGSGYKCQLTVRSGSFAYDGGFYFDDSHLRKAVEALHRMNSSLTGESILKGAWEEDHFKLRVDQSGHVIVSGVLLHHSELSQSLSFAFRTDQTVLEPFREGLASLFAA